MSKPLAGSLRALMRYPVKSMAGEVLTVGHIVPGQGVQGDRVFAVLDVETNRIASAKHPRRWGALLACTASFVAPLAAGQRRAPVAIALPGGITVRSDHPGCDDIVSVALGRTVRLAEAPPPQAVYDEAPFGRDELRTQPLAVGAGEGTFFDLAPIHLVTTASLARLGELRPMSDFAAQRFRPNLVIDTGTRGGFVENDWLGQIVAIGDEVQLCITFPSPRCVMTTLAQGALPADPEVLRTVAEHNRQMFALLAKTLPTLGAYATVVRGGTVRPGDPVRLEGRAPLRRAASVVHIVKRVLLRR